MNRPSFEEVAMEQAYAAAKRSTCYRRHVGCVLLDSKGRALAIGYNGVARGLPHCNEESGEVFRLDGPHRPHLCLGSHLPSGQGLHGCEAIHAEQNALLQCANVDQIVVCVTTTAPCIDCTKLLLQTGCQHIVYSEDYPHMDASVALWVGKAGRLWSKLDVR